MMQARDHHTVEGALAAVAAEPSCTFQLHDVASLVYREISNARSPLTAKRAVRANCQFVGSCTCPFRDAQAPLPCPAAPA